LQDQGKLGSLNDCKVNDKGKVTELSIYPYCFENEQLETVLSYKTIETLEFAKIIPYWDTGFIYESYIENLFGCATIPTNYEKLRSITNLKYLDLTGVINLDINVIANIPKSVKILKIGREKHPEYFKLTQEIVDTLGQLTNLNSLTLLETELNEDLVFQKFKNLKKLTFLEMIYDYYNNSNKYIQGNLFRYCTSLKKLVISCSKFGTDSFDGFNYLTPLEELKLEIPVFEDGVDFSSINKLSHLTSLIIDCINKSKLKTISSNFFHLTKLKSFTINGCGATIPTSDSLTWANLKNLEHLELSNRGLTNFDFEFFNDLPNLKELHIEKNQFSSSPEIIGNLKNLEVLEILYEYYLFPDNLPLSIFDLPKLRVLKISSDKITSIPDEIGNLKNLQELESNFNKELTSLPETIGNLVNLRTLNLLNNHLNSLPTSIGNLSKLETLNAIFNYIPELPPSFGNLTNIADIRLTGNDIEELPDDIGNLKNLVLLELDFNKITNIPSSLGDLKKLEVLNLYNNLIDDLLPESLNDLPNLRKINLGENINIKGKSLNNTSLTECNYTPLAGYTYSMCVSANATCKDNTDRAPQQPCEEE